MSDNKIIHELLKEVRENQRESESKAQEHREDTIKWQSGANARLDKYNSELEVHIEGVNELKGLHHYNDDRITALEEPREVRKVLIKKAILLGKVCGAIISVLALIKLFQ